MYDVPRSLYSLMFRGVMEEFPDLKFISVDNDVGSLPHYLQRLDWAYEKYRANNERTPPAPRV